MYISLHVTPMSELAVPKISNSPVIAHSASGRASGRGRVSLPPLFMLFPASPAAHVFQDHTSLKHKLDQC